MKLKNFVINKSKLISLKCNKHGCYYSFYHKTEKNKNLRSSFESCYNSFSSFTNSSTCVDIVKTLQQPMQLRKKF